MTLLGQLGGDPADSVVLTAETMLASTATGGFLAAPTLRDGEGAIYERLGAPGRTLGRLGDGPGENGRILGAFPWLGDSVLFAGFDRLTILSNLEGIGRTVRLERPSPSHRTVVLAHEGLVVRNYAYPPDRQFVVFDRDGAVHLQLGRATSVGGRADITQVLAELGPASSGHQFWSAPQRYDVRMDLWDARTGNVVRSFQDSVSWYTPYDSAALHRFLLAGNDAENPPPPFLRGIRETQDSVLWLVYNVPARNWAPRRDTLPPLQRGYHPEAYDAIINLKDPTSGQSLLTAWVNLPFARVVNDTLLADRRQNDDGFWVYDVYRVALRR